MRQKCNALEVQIDESSEASSRIELSAMALCSRQQILMESVNEGDGAAVEVAEKRLLSEKERIRIASDLKIDANVRHVCQLN
jgi:hypothetical protein